MTQAEALKTAIRHIDHMAAWITKQNAGYSFESLGEDMPGIRAALAPGNAGAVEADDFERFPYDDERFNKGVQHVVELFAKTLGIDDWEAGDGSENYDDDLQQTLLNIMEARNIYDPETGLIGFAAAPLPATQGDGE